MTHSSPAAGWGPMKIGAILLAIIAAAWVLAFPLQADPLSRLVLAFVEAGPFP